MLGRKPETIGVRPRCAGGGAPREGAQPAAPPAVAGGAGGSAGAGPQARCPARLLPATARQAAGGVGVREVQGRDRRSAARRMSRGTAPATSSLPTALERRQQAHRQVRQGRKVPEVVGRAERNGQFNGVRSLAIDAQGNVYVADAGNKRIQVFDGDGNFKSQISNIGAPQALCISRGATQYIYSAHSGDPDGIVDAAIYKLALRQGARQVRAAGKLPKQFGLVNSIDCRNENELLVGEMINWRVQKITLKK